MIDLTEDAMTYDEWAIMQASRRGYFGPLSLRDVDDEYAVTLDEGDPGD